MLWYAIIILLYSVIIIIYIYIYIHIYDMHNNNDNNRNTQHNDYVSYIIYVHTYNLCRKVVNLTS